MSELIGKIQQAEDLKTDSVVMEEWGNLEVHLREPSVSQINAVNSKYAVIGSDGKPDMGKSDGEMIGFGMLAICVVDNGEKVFKDADHAKEVLGDKSAKAVAKLIQAASKICGLSAEDAEKN